MGTIAKGLTHKKYDRAIQDPIHKQLSSLLSGCKFLIWSSILPGLSGIPRTIMSRGLSSFGWASDETSNYTNPDEDISSYEACYGVDTGYTNPAGAQCFSEFDQPTYTSQGTMSILKSPRLPPENLTLHESESYSWSNHSNFDFSGPISSSNYRYPNP
jgi:hypothetical protein